VARGSDHKILLKWAGWLRLNIFSLTACLQRSDVELAKRNFVAHGDCNSIGFVFRLILFCRALAGVSDEDEPIVTFFSNAEGLRRSRT
jgi:hypothetical protein